MNTRIRKIAVKCLIAGGILVMAAGCATTKQLEEVRAEAEAARQMASEARSMVTNARGMIEDALEQARAARAAANASQNCCDDLERKLDRALREMQEK